MTKNKTLTLEELRRLLDYNPETGIFTRKISRSRLGQCGQIAGYTTPYGYRYIGIAGRYYPAHHLAWFYVYGSWPTHEIDHINGERSDNRLANLRDVTRTVNMQNLKRSRKDNTLGIFGVNVSRGRYLAQIQVNGKKIALGRFSTPEEAHATYLEAKRKYHKECTL